MRIVSHLMAGALVVGACFPEPQPRDQLDTTAEPGDSQQATDEGSVDDTAPVDSVSSVDGPVDSLEPADGLVPLDTSATADTGSDKEVAEVGCTEHSACAHLDALPCLVGRCGGNGHCVTEPAVAACDDGDPCTRDDSCDAGSCVGRLWTADEARGWAAVIGGPGDDVASDIIIHPSGEVTVVGGFEQWLAFGDQNLTARGDGTLADVYVARFTADGSPKWIAQAGGAGLDFATAAAGEGEDLWVVGWSLGAATFGNGEMRVDIDSGPAGGSFLARFDAAGGMSTVRRLPSFARTLLSVGGGDVVVTGEFKSPIQFETGAEPLTASPIDSAGDVYAARLTASGVAWLATMASAEADGLDLFGGGYPVAYTARSGGTVLVSAYVGAQATFTSPAGSQTLGTSTASHVLASVGLAGGQLLGTHVEAFEDAAGLVVLTGAAPLPGGGFVRSGIELTDPDLETYNIVVRGDGWAQTMAGLQSTDIPIPVSVVNLGPEDIGIVGSFQGTLVLDDGPLAPALVAAKPRAFLARYSTLGVARSATLVGPALWPDDLPYKTDPTLSAASGMQLAPTVWAGSPSRGEACVAAVFPFLDEPAGPAALVPQHLYEPSTLQGVA